MKKQYKKRAKKYTVKSVTIIAGVWQRTIIEFEDGTLKQRFRLKDVGD